MSNNHQGTKAPNPDQYPEHEKLKAVREQSQAVGEFVEWLHEKGIYLGEYRDFTYTWTNEAGQERIGTRTEFSMTTRRMDDLLAEFFEIDQKKLEAEKRAMLDACRERFESV